MLKPSDVMKLPEGKHGDGDGLMLVVKGGSRCWVLRISINGKRREAGLGSAAKVSLALARKNRDALLEQWRNGVDPIEERRKAKQAAAAEAKRKTFAEAADAVIEKNRAGWKTSLEGRCSTLAQWRRDAEVTCKPIARKFLDEITIADVKSDGPALLGSGAARQRPVVAEAHRGDLRLRHCARLDARATTQPRGTSLSICGRARRSRTCITPRCLGVTRRNSCSACASRMRPAPACLNSSC